MDGKNRLVNNIMLERCFRSLKTEQIYSDEYKLRIIIKRYIGKYNKIQPHEALDYKVPDAVYYSVFAA